MSQSASIELNEIGFDYSPELPLTAEQRIELLEVEVAELREQISALVECLTPREE